MLYGGGQEMKREIRLTIWTGILICAVFLIAGCENFAEAPAPSNQPRSLFSADLAARLEEHEAEDRRGAGKLDLEQL